MGAEGHKTGHLNTNDKYQVACPAHPIGTFTVESAALKEAGAIILSKLRFLQGIAHTLEIAACMQ